MNKFSLLNKFIVQEEKIEDMVNILLAAAESMETLDECEIYLVSIADNEPNSVYVYEVWTDESSHQASLSLEVTQKLISQAKPIITGMERISTLKTKGGKGVSKA
ncbi:MAG: antibiotic biosynthesis monooxygenase [Psychrobacillus psychrodurans]